MVFHSYKPEDTENIGAEIAEKANAGDIFCLSGDLGAGKTVFAKGFAKGLGITDNITSPTFIIVNVYEGSLPLYHFDMYRIVDGDEIYNTGYEEYFYGDGVCLVEWPENTGEYIPPNAKWIFIERDYTKPEDYRRIRVEK